MAEISLFISYSHEDEWLKNEFITHLSGLRRSGFIKVWHDRKILPGGHVGTKIDENLAQSQIVCLLVSPAFIASNYCMEIEYQTAVGMQNDGTANIVPIIVRECDWDVANLREMLALPPDALAVTKGAHSSAEPSSRDGKWLSVVSGLKEVIKEVNLRYEPKDFNPKYVEQIFTTNQEQTSYFNVKEDVLFIDPEIYHINDDRSYSDFDDFVRTIAQNHASIVFGEDRCGKTLTAKILQSHLQKTEIPILINGSDITNTNFEKILMKSAHFQFRTRDIIWSRLVVIIDDFEACKLADHLKESFIRFCISKSIRLILFSFSDATSVLFTAQDLPEPMQLQIQPMTKDKVLKLIERWLNKNEIDNHQQDKIILKTFEQVAKLFNQTELLAYPYYVFMFLDLIEKSSGNDIAHASFVSCYDALIQQSLLKSHVSHRGLDEAKNFMSLVAYSAFLNEENGGFDDCVLQKCLLHFSEQYLSDAKYLERMATNTFIKMHGERYSFNEEYLFYYFCARYYVLFVSRDNPKKFANFCEECANNVHQKKYANIAIFVSYFSTNDVMIKALIEKLGSLFRASDEWRVSDVDRALLLGLTNNKLAISRAEDYKDERDEILRSRVGDIIENAEKLVAQYTLPFYHHSVTDIESEPDQSIENAVDLESFQKNVNLMYRIHSVLGQILTNRAGTYQMSTITNAIEKMVMCSGRFTRLHLSIAALLIYDKEKTIDQYFDYEQMKISETLWHKKIIAIYSYWAFYLAQGSLSRHLAQDHCIRALDKLIEVHEGQNGGREVPFNFSTVRFLADVWNERRVDKSEILKLTKKYGDQSAVFGIMRQGVYFFANYMPVSYSDKQWISKKLQMRISSLRKQEYRSMRFKLIEKNE